MTMTLYGPTHTDLGALRTVTFSSGEVRDVMVDEHGVESIEFDGRRVPIERGGKSPTELHLRIIVDRAVPFPVAVRMGIPAMRRAVSAMRDLHAQIAPAVDAMVDAAITDMERFAHAG